jgi:hypothetical protein
MKSKPHNLPPVADLPVAPHRYLWNAPIAPAPETWHECRDAAPYQPGEVILVVYGDGYARAYVDSIGCKRDYYGDLRETYNVRRETKSGQWAKRTYETHPGLIQRAYQRAGQAPDVPESLLA